MALTVLTQAKKIHRKCAIIMPAYNEEAVLPDTLKEWHPIAQQIEGMLVIINDGSKDNSLNLLKEALSHYDRLIVIDKNNSGHGQTCLTGYAWAIKENFEWIFQTDSDRQIQSEDFLRAWQEKGHDSFVFGHRIVRGDGIARVCISAVLRYVILLIFHVHVRDANVPFRIMNVRRLKPYIKDIPDDLNLANAYLTILIVKYSPHHLKWRQIRFQPRTGGIPSVSLPKFFVLGIKTFKEFIKMRKHFNTIGHDISPSV